MRFLTTPWVDKSIAVVAVLPFTYPLFLHFREFRFNLPDVVYLVQTSVLVATMVFRRTPVRITPNPFYWLLAFVASYWSFFSISVEEHGRPLAPRWVTNSLSVASILLMTWARVNLGRNIGFVPAQRDLVDRGLYRYMRHPIYTSFFILMIGLALAGYSPRNLLLFSLAVFWFVTKSFVEESFLRQDPQYADYMQRVRWRWLPGIA